MSLRHRIFSALKSPNSSRLQYSIYYRFLDAILECRGMHSHSIVGMNERSCGQNRVHPTQLTRCSTFYNLLKTISFDKFIFGGFRYALPALHLKSMSY